MRKILAIAWKDTLVRFSSMFEWLFFLILPVAFTIILAGGTGGGADSRIRMVVVDDARTPLSAELLAALSASKAVRPETLPREQAEAELDARRTPVLLVIPAGLDGQSMARGTVALELRRQAGTLDTLAAERAVRAAISRIGRAMEIAAQSVSEADRVRPFESDGARQAWFDGARQEAQAMLDEAPGRLAVVSAATKDQIPYEPRANSSAGQLITWVFIPLIGISVMFAYERQKGTLRRLLTTPTGKATYLLGTITGMLIAALVQMALLVGFGALVMKVGWGRAPGALAAMLVASGLSAAALGTMLGVFVKTEGQANGLSILIGMVMALLGGCWYPIELFPQYVRSLVKALPTTWAMQGLLDVIIRGQGFAAILPEAGMLLGFAAVFFTIGVWRFRSE